ncbi:MAG: hypothetical protein AUH85_15255 [Chloroflexi bacterium 13_1_40CM_4_68_4]|nr:MAG: hypothetical protein AUH85_15255 [Chloroflexi bacterium 13_1_40CM_4_68_4]
MQLITLRSFRREEDAQGIVEFALVLPVIFLLIFGIIDLARAVWEENTLAYAAREGTRYAIVHGSGCESPCVETWPATYSTDTCSTAGTIGACGPIFTTVRNAAIGVPNVTVTVRWRDQKAGNPCYDRTCHVSVDATAPFVPLPSQYLIGGAFQITLRGGSELVIQR